MPDTDYAFWAEIARTDRDTLLAALKLIEARGKPRA